MTTNDISGVVAPVITPFRPDHSVDTERAIEFCRWLLSQNCGLAVFGTNSEANSLSLDERLDLLDQLVAAGIDPKRMMPGTGCCSTVETAKLTTKAVELGCAGVLMLPPFYYKGVSDDGLFAAFADVIERVGDARLRIYLYHIPPVAQVGISLGLTERLLKAYPDTVVGMKDSSGDWSNSKAMLDAFPDLRMFVGSETFLLDNMRNGGVGCISAIANVNPDGIDALYRNWQSAGADDQQSQLNKVRQTMQNYPMIPALKATAAEFSGQDGWRKVRPPLVALSDHEKAALLSDLDAIGFAMNIKQA
jgi:4-hydroxy-tetrahydrodipicolinate synthase